jgi:adenylate kinase family enzyme
VERVAVVGPGGAGKSTFAEQLGATFLDATLLDAAYRGA